MSHPDFYEGLMDWPLYGPRDPEIADQVRVLADKGLRLAEIEDVIKRALKGRLQELEREAGGHD